MDLQRDTRLCIEAAKSFLQYLIERKQDGQNSYDRTSMAEDCLIGLLGDYSSNIAPDQQSHNESFRAALTTSAYLPCETPLEELHAIALQDLELGSHHRGKYLPLRAIAPPSRATGILVLAEDEFEFPIILYLHQQEEEHVRKATDIVDVGALLLVKEPYFDTMIFGTCGIQVDHLSDVIYVDKDDARVPEAWRSSIGGGNEDSAEAIKMKGNLEMAQKNHLQAIREYVFRFFFFFGPALIIPDSYTRALSQRATPDQIEVIKRNRALAFLETKQFDAALSDTGFPNFGPDPTEKALARAAKALYFLGRFKEAREVLKKLCQRFPDNKDGTGTLDRVEKRCAEQNTGDYDFRFLQAEAKKRHPPVLDHATYFGPIEVKETQDKGRGLFATKAVRAGDLLLCEKAFGYIDAHGYDDGRPKITVTTYTEKENRFIRARTDLVRLIVQKIHRNPSLVSAFTAMHHGSYQTANTCVVDGKPIVDTFLTQRIVSLNVFNYELSSLITHKRLRSMKHTATHSWGIWIKASTINHSCTSNAYRSIIGDMMIVRARQDLEPGTEITISYCGSEEDDEKIMQEQFEEWQFTCACAICQDEQQTEASVLAGRRQLMDKLDDACGSTSRPDIQTEAVEQLLRALKNTYTRPANEVPRMRLSQAQLLLAYVYNAQNKMDKVFKFVDETLISFGFILAGLDSTRVSFKIIKWGLVEDQHVEVFRLAQEAFEKIQAREDAMQAEEYARTAFKIVVGEDSSFESVYGK
ncbi:hypothetical protein N0V83_000146 [Neocucurbitaria cava]|uniref:SET domain-containing protein n=1 Tax=Neocucurbitaria cava TaxID=798079 RepID=A0A9W8YH80_9PLEO|nr:hypothetical protein N0V83_000146 [Neocucurbitaria cava]